MSSDTSPTNTFIINTYDFLANNYSTYINEENCNNSVFTNYHILNDLCKNLKLSKEYMNLTTKHLGKEGQYKDSELIYKDQYRKIINTLISIGLVSFFIIKINNSSI